MSLVKLAASLLLIMYSASLTAQDTLVLNHSESEALFLKENLLLMAERLNISQAEARVVQARLWPNPALEIDEVNLWATKRQLAVFGDELQGFNGGRLGQNQQFGFSVEQLVMTAGKRKKLAALESVSVEQSHEFFENLLRNLKYEFRSFLTRLHYLRLTAEAYQSQLNSVKQLTQSYHRQVEKGHVTKGEYVRLKALELEIGKGKNDLGIETEKIKKELKMMMRLPASVQLTIEPERYLNNEQPVGAVDLSELITQAKEFRPDFRLAQLDVAYQKRKLDYEQALRVPDVTLKMGYDRGGNFMYNFFGFGVAMDIPVFDRNQGNIQQARIGIEQSKLHVRQKELSLENEVVLAYQNLQQSIDFYTDIDPDLDEALDATLDGYTRNFLNRNITLLEYLDFLDAYLENKKILRDARHAIIERVEELNYLVGVDVIQ